MNNMEQISQHDFSLTHFSVNMIFFSIIFFVMIMLVVASHIPNSFEYEAAFSYCNLSASDHDCFGLSARVEACCWSIYSQRSHCWTRIVSSMVGEFWSYSSFCCSISSKDTRSTSVCVNGAGIPVMNVADTLFCRLLNILIFQDRLAWGIVFQSFSALDDQETVTWPLLSNDLGVESNSHEIYFKSISLGFISRPAVID